MNACQTISKLCRSPALLALLLPLVSGAAAAATYDLVAMPFVKAMPGGGMVTMWGFALDDGNPQPSVPGPALVVPAGDTTLTINLRNALTGPGAEPVSIVIPGQLAAMSPVKFTDDSGRQRVRSFTAEAAIGAVQSYTWNNLKPGTYLYHSGTHPQVQVQMGLYGAMTHDAVAAGSGPAEAYAGVAYDSQVTLLFSEVDPALHEAVATGQYGPGTAMTSTIDYAPKYFLINGEAHPHSSLTLPIGNVGQTTLVRLLNAGLQSRTPMLQGHYMHLIAEDGNPYPYSREQYSAFLPALKTADVLITPTAPATYPLYDRRLATVNPSAAGSTTGGMLAFLIASGAGENTAPSITSAAVTAATVGEAYSYDVDATDPDAGDVLTYSLDTAPTGMTIDGTTGVISWTPDAAGDANVTVRVTDTGGLFATQSFVIDVSAAGANTVPTITSTAVTAATVGQPYAYDVNATDPDAGDVLTFSLDAAPTGMSIDPASGLIAWTPDAVGDANVTVRVTDSGGLFTTQSFTITVQPAGAPGVLLYFSTALDTAVPGVTGTPDNADVYSWDGSVFARVFDATEAGLPLNASVDGVKVTATHLYLSFANDLGVEVPGIGLVQDEDIVVYDRGTGTWSLYFDGSAVGLDTSSNEDVDAFDILGDGSLVLSTVGGVSVPGLAGTWADEDAIRCVPTSSAPIASCTWNVYFDGSDIGLATVTSEDIDGLSVGAGRLYFSTVGIYGVEGQSNDTTNAGGDILACEGAVTGTDTSCTSFSLYFRAADHGLTGNINALSVPTAPAGNTAPTITSTAVTAATVGEAYSYDVDATDLDAGDVLTYSLDTAPTGMTIDATTGVISWTPDAAGDANVTVRVTDTGGLFATQSFTINVTAAGANTAPTITSTAVTAATVAQPYAYDVDATDPDAGDVLTYSLDAAPAGMTIDPASGLIAWTPDAAGDANVTVRVTDSGGLFATQSFTITVQPAGTPGVMLYFSTALDTAVPGVAGTPDNADVYSWDGSVFARVFDATEAGLPLNASVDGVKVTATHLYLSFANDLGVEVPGIGLVQDEDIVAYDRGTGTWSLYFDGSAVGLDTSSNEDVDAFDILGDGSLVLSTVGGVSVPGLAGTWADEDAIRCVPTSTGPIASCTWNVYFDGSDVGLATVTSEDIDGLSVGAGRLYFSTIGIYGVEGQSNDTTNAGGDILACEGAVTGTDTSCTGFTLYFRAADHGLTGNINALSVQ